MKYYLERLLEFVALVSLISTGLIMSILIDILMGA